MRNLALLFAFVATPALAAEPLNWGEINQGDVSGMGTYATGIGVGGSNEFEPNFGYIGFNGEVMYHLLPYLSVGAGAGYQLFWGKERDTIELDNAALNSTQFRYLDVAPVLDRQRVLRVHPQVGEVARHVQELEAPVRPGAHTVDARVRCTEDLRHVAQPQAVAHREHVGVGNGGPCLRDHAPGDALEQSRPGERDLHVAPPGRHALAVRA